MNNSDFLMTMFADYDQIAAQARPRGIMEDAPGMPLDGSRPDLPQQFPGLPYLPQLGQPYMESRDPTVRERLNMALAGGASAGSTHQRYADKLAGTSGELSPIDLVPGPGDVMAFNEAQTPLDYGLATVGLIPAAGKPLKAIAKGVKEAVPAAKGLLSAAFPEMATRMPALVEPRVMAKMPAGKVNAKGEAMYDGTTNAPVTPLGEDLQPLPTHEARAAAVEGDRGLFFAKVKSPEEVKFAKARAKVRKDVQAGYEDPFFDPKKRADIDPKDYPTSTVTTRDALPKTTKAQDAWLLKVDTPAVKARLKAAYERGSKVPNSKNWYHVKQLDDFARKEFGDKKGRELMREFFGRLSATTAGQAPEGNLLMAHFMKYADEAGMPVKSGFDMPHPVGGQRTPDNINQSKKLMAMPESNRAFDANNPKRHDFQHAFLGHDTTTIDEQMMKIFDPSGKLAKPPGDSYGVYAKVAQDVADELGIPRKELQEVAWHGLKSDSTLPGMSPQHRKAAEEFFKTGGEPFIETINKAIERTHRLTGTPKKEIARGLLSGKHPLYSVAPAGLLGAAAAANQQEK